MDRRDIATAKIAARIFVLRGERVILDSDLAALYGVQTRRLNEQVRRNPRRFPSDFMIIPTNQELAILKSQIATSSWGGKRKSPVAFTEHGAIMAATVLNSPRAIEVSVYVVRAFVQMREALVSHKEIGKRLDELGRRVGTHDRAIHEIFDALRQLTQPPGAPRHRRIGFVWPVGDHHATAAAAGGIRSYTSPGRARPPNRCAGKPGSIDPDQPGRAA